MVGVSSGGVQGGDIGAPIRGFMSSSSSYAHTLLPRDQNAGHSWSDYGIAYVQQPPSTIPIAFIELSLSSGVRRDEGEHTE